MASIINFFIQYFFLLIILIIGLVICYEDFKFGKIRNKWIKLGFILGFIVYLLSLIISLISGQPIAWQDYLMILSNTLIAFIFAFALWYLKLWAGGDAKLFTFYAFLIPLDFYGNWYFKYWPALALLINIVMPIFIYLIIKMLLYPAQLFFNYLKHPQLFAEYFKKYQEKNKIDKTKIKDYLAAGLSFLAILIFFQVLRNRLGDLLNPYLGNLMTVSYFFLGYTAFKPLRAIMQKWLFVALILIGLYFGLGIFFYSQLIFADLHKLIALQMIFMLSFFYIFKYGKDLAQFLYNSAEVKIIPLAELQSGVYLNKEYIRQIMGTRSNSDNFQKELVV